MNPNDQYVCRANIRGGRSVGKAFLLPTTGGRGCYLTYFDGSAWQRNEASPATFEVMVDPDPVCFKPTFVSSTQPGAFARALHFEESGMPALHVCRMTVATAQATGTELGRVGALPPDDVCRTELWGAVYLSHEFELLTNPSRTP
jgi:hypothetical protein